MRGWEAKPSTRARVRLTLDAAQRPVWRQSFFRLLLSSARPAAQRGVAAVASTEPAALGAEKPVLSAPPIPARSPSLLPARRRALRTGWCALPSITLPRRPEHAA